MADQPSAGGTDLRSLIKSMNPSLDANEFVFAHIPYDIISSEELAKLVASAEMLFREREGWAVILTRTEASQMSLRSIFPSRKITLNVHSSLDAVGFLAAVTSRLAEKLGMGVNPVSGYFHDHLFVPLGRANDVMKELKKMAREQE